MKSSSRKKVITVAYADDHVAVRKGIASYLNILGGIRVVMEADNGKELLTKLENAVKKPDVCILDLKMPVLNGFDVVPIIRKKWKDMKILVLSTYVEELYVVKMIRAGVNGYLSKSCDPDEIKDALISIVNEGKYHSKLFIEGMASVMETLSEEPTRLTEKEKILLNYCCSSLNYAEISREMKTTLKSVEGYRDQLFRKCRVNNRVSLVLYALKNGMIQLDNVPD